MNIRKSIERVCLLVVATGWAVLFFAYIASADIKNIDSSRLTIANSTVWHMVYPVESTWITDTTPITMQVRITNSFGIHNDFGYYERLGDIGLHFPVRTFVGTQTLIMTDGSVTMSEGTSNLITYTIITSETGTTESHSFTFKQDSIPPTGTFVSPISTSVWSTGEVVSMTWDITDTTSGLSQTQVYFRLSPSNQPQLVGSAVISSLTWTVPMSASNEAAVLLAVTDNAGNYSLIASSLFSVTLSRNKHAYLPFGSYDCANQSSDWCEPNNTITTSMPFTFNYPITATINTVSDRRDYYRVSLNTYRTYTFTLRLVPPCADLIPKCDLDLYLYPVTPPFSYKDASNFTNIGNEQIVYSPTVTGDYALLVYAVDSYITGTQYTLVAK